MKIRLLCVFLTSLGYSAFAIAKKKKRKEKKNNVNHGLRQRRHQDEQVFVEERVGAEARAWLGSQGNSFLAPEQNKGTRKQVTVVTHYLNYFIFLWSMFSY